jgi:hypothetical protein
MLRACDIISKKCRPAYVGKAVAEFADEVGRVESHGSERHGTLSGAKISQIMAIRTNSSPARIANLSSTYRDGLPPQGRHIARGGGH